MFSTGVRLLFDSGQDATVVSTNGDVFPVLLSDGAFAQVNFTVQDDESSSELLTIMLDLRQSLRFDDIDREMGVFGDPDYCVERVRALRREYQMDEFICYFNQGGIMDHATVRASMTLFAREVMPHFATERQAVAARGEI